ncbi:hypothetical protein [Rhizobium leucaenae]|uniref:Uncharacterized protein n=1 Tax=Rhizobium leucaenae TaxID=29450 RepID=A0A7W6ZZQ8_9HYPH|nr:hypothetical protein [Rhizobium leucaenae]MBB4571150.1 hypothetical protein [Rhizobium leucaenae]MBB6304117.1 hypothetical protein [Rhizobium leucaenae]
MAVSGSSKDCQSSFAGANISTLFDSEPGAAASAARAVYGTDATLAVAWCALCAKMDGRVLDGHFWFEVFSLLRGGGGLSVAEPKKMRPGRPTRRRLL